MAMVTLSRQPTHKTVASTYKGTSIELFSANIIANVYRSADISCCCYAHACFAYTPPEACTIKWASTHAIVILTLSSSSSSEDTVVVPMLKMANV